MFLASSGRQASSQNAQLENLIMFFICENGEIFELVSFVHSVLEVLKEQNI